MNRYQKFFKHLAAGAMAILLCALAILPASAMSPIEPDPGIDVFGVFPKGRKSQLSMESLALTYDIPELPADEFDQSELLEKYSSTLRLDYTFSNPTDTEQTVKMMFAAANAPSYAQRLCTRAQLASFYTVEVGGERVTPELRYAWTPNSQNYQTGRSGYDPRDWAENLQDSYAAHSLLSPDLPVTVYTYQPYSTSGNNESFYCDMVADFDYDASRTLIFSDKHVDVYEENAIPQMRVRVSKGSLVTLYVLGEDIGEVNWKLTDDGKRVGGCDVQLVEQSTTTFGELAMSEYDPDAGIPEKDWYNAVFSMLICSQLKDTCLIGYQTRMELDVTSNLQGFLTYDVTLGAGESTVNSITLPVYPDVMEYYSPKAATFTYHFHGSSDWKSVGKYTVRIDTKLKIMTDERNSLSVDNYKKDRKGYTLSERSTPKSGVYYVTLCKWKNPIETSGFAFIWFLFLFFVLPVLLVILGAVVAIVLVIVLILLIIRLIRRKAQKKAE
ncbi:MAG: hypothetical protein IKB28_09405 [Clostridia bacterium]|nr:hypothetical protein [Clostridia bacterium]